MELKSGKRKKNAGMAAEWLCSLAVEVTCRFRFYVWGGAVEGKARTPAGLWLSRGGAGKTEQGHNTPSPNKDNHDTATLGKGQGRSQACEEDFTSNCFFAPCGCGCGI